jgi:nitroimidazol reductase NimA-like FMN-containing flavoprotein (pyridoxamine 5'-phosphate oxidase superfamily)
VANVSRPLGVEYILRQGGFVHASTDEQDRAAVVRAIVDDNLYLVLGTADQAGRPWVTPVYFAHADYCEFVWVSSPAAQHSRNIAARREVSIVVFDSTVPIGTGQAVYVSALAEELAGDDCAEGIDVFSRRSLAHGGREWTLEDVQAPARRRLYRAKAMQHYILDEHDERMPVDVSRPA